MKENKQVKILTILGTRTLSRLNRFEAWRPFWISCRLIEIVVFVICITNWLKWCCGSWIWCFGGLWLGLILLSLIRIFFEPLPIVIVRIIVTVLHVAETCWRLLRITALAVSSHPSRLCVSISIIVAVLRLLLMRWQIVSTILLLLLLLLLLMSIWSVFIVVIIMQHILMMLCSRLI